MWYPPAFDGKQHDLQFWNIATDGSGQLRAELKWPDSDSSPRFVVCETHTLMWLTGMHHELAVLDKLNPPESPKETEAELSFGRALASQAKMELEWLLDSPASRRSAIEVLLLNRNPERTGAVVKIDGKLRQVTFRRVDGALLLASITRDEGETTYRFVFKDYHQFGERWIPTYKRFPSRVAPPAPSAHHPPLLVDPERLSLNSSSKNRKPSAVCNGWRR